MQKLKVIIVAGLLVTSTLCAAEDDSCLAAGRPQAAGKITTFWGLVGLLAPKDADKAAKELESDKKAIVLASCRSIKAAPDFKEGQNMLCSNVQEVLKKCGEPSRIGTFTDLYDKESPHKDNETVWYYDTPDKTSVYVFNMNFGLQVLDGNGKKDITNGVGQLTDSYVASEAGYVVTKQRDLTPAQQSTSSTPK